MDNLDILAARCAQEVVRALVPEGVEEAKKKAGALGNVTTKALGVLQEQGVYAGMLFLYSKVNDPYTQQLREKLLEVLNRPEMTSFALGFPHDKDKRKWQDVSEHLADKVCNDLDTLLLVKQVWEQTLIYVRYGAKARG